MSIHVDKPANYRPAGFLESNSKPKVKSNSKPKVESK